MKYKKFFETIIKIAIKFYSIIFKYLRNLNKILLSIFNAKRILKIREHSIRSLNDYVELIDVLGMENEIAVRALFAGISAESIIADKVVLYFVDNENMILYPVIIMTYKNGRVFPYDYYSEIKDINIKFGEDIAGNVAQLKKEIIDINISNSKFYRGIIDKRINFTPNSVIALPLFIDDQIFSVLEVSNSKNNRNLSMIDFYTLSIISKITMFSMEKTKLYNWSIRDNLTNLYNYHYFQIAFDKEIARSKRYPQNIGIIICDIDNFKKINDTFGHLAGNVVLKGVSDIIFKSIRNNVDIPIRYGGDEFLIILPETDIKGAEKVAERILNLIREAEFKFQRDKIKATISIGVTYAKEGELINKENLIKKADDALYEAKRSGKNRVILKV